MTKENTIKTIKSEIEGLEIFQPDIYSDSRGWLIEIFRKDQLAENNMPVMAYLSLTHPNTTRGPHEHRNQSDLIFFAGPSTFRIKLWDNREDSVTFGNSTVLEGGQDNPLVLVIPAGVVHAYKNTGKCDGLVFNAPDRLYRGEGKSGEVDEIRYENQEDSKFNLNF